MDSEILKLLKENNELLKEILQILKGKNIKPEDFIMNVLANMVVNK